jgi:flagella basal body P-ring formation protein FlgA
MSAARPDRVQLKPTLLLPCAAGKEKRGIGQCLQDLVLVALSASRRHAIGRADVSPLIFALALSVVGAPACALAGQPVELKPHPMARGYITLGDLFENATEAAARVVVIHAPPPGLDAVLEASEIQMLARREGLAHITVASLPGATSGFRGALGSSGAHSGARSSHRAPREDVSANPARTLVYARNLSPREIVQASDLQWSTTSVAGGDSLDAPALAIGKSTRHFVRAGSAVEAYDLARPKLIHAGDAVEVAYENDGVVLTLEAKAISDATLGDTVEVINPTSKKSIEAVASAPGRALVGPRADALKASMLSSPLTTAALN